jgi:hypothetical protein
MNRRVGVNLIIAIVMDKDVEIEGFVEATFGNMENIYRLVTVTVRPKCDAYL